MPSRWPGEPLDLHAVSKPALTIKLPDLLLQQDRQAA